MKRNLFLAFNAALALVFLGVLAASVDLNRLFAAIGSADLFLLLAAAFFYFLTQLASAARYKILLSNYSLSSYFASHVKAMLASDATPGRVGYSYFVFDMRAKGLKGGKGTKLMGVSLASDFLVRGILALVAVWLYSQEFGQVGVAVLAASVLAFALLFVKLDALSKLFSKVPFYGRRLENAYHAVVSMKTSKRQLGASVFASFAGAFARGMEWVLVFYAVGKPISLVGATVACALLTALSFVPVSIAGFGLQEGGGMVLLSTFFGFTIAQAGGVMIIVRFLDVVCDLLLGGWFFLLSAKTAKD